MTELGQGYVTLAARLRQALRESGMGVEEAARRLSGHSSGRQWATERRALYRALSGDAVRKKSRLAAWARLFKKPPDYFEAAEVLPPGFAQSFEGRLGALETLAAVRLPLLDELSTRVADNAQQILLQAEHILDLEGRIAALEPAQRTPARRRGSRA